MRRGIAFAGAALAVLATWAPSVSAAPTQIEFGSFYFSPDDVTVDFVPGENTFEWNRNDPNPDFHSITSKGGSFATGVGGFTDFDLRASAGTYPYYCTNHGANGFGMIGQVAVRPIVGEIDADGFDVTWADPDTDTGGDFQARWKVKGQRKWKTSWIFHFESVGREFGRNDNPTDVKPGKTYVIQVRSSTPGLSKWSPSLSVTVEP